MLAALDQAEAGLKRVDLLLPFLLYRSKGKRNSSKAKGMERTWHSSTPLPMSPGGQTQVNLSVEVVPSASVQMAFLWQLWVPSMHSLMLSFWQLGLTV